MKRFYAAMAASAMAIGAFAQTDAPVETRAYYSTNPSDAVGKYASISIDDEFSDWTDDMIVATCGANDMCNAFHGSHENCVVDLYAVYAAWDDANLYLAWQMCNSGDTWARPGDGPLTDYGRVGDVPIIVALSLDPSKPGMTGKLQNGNHIWGGAQSGVQFSSHVDRLFFMSAKVGQGAPAMFTAVDAAGNTDYGAGCHLFSSIGVTYKMKEGFAPSHYWRQNTYADWADATTLISDPSIINNIYDAANYDNLLAGPVEGLKPHDTSYDSFFEMKIPFTALGITREWLENNGLGVRVVGTRGESGIDCCPFDASMVDEVFGEYAKDNSTSHEKDDIDVITYALASVGKLRSGSVDPLPDPTPTPDPDPTPTPGPDPDPTPAPDGNYVVYFDNANSGWSQVYTWIWDSANANLNFTGGNWPGTTMTVDPALGYHKYTFSYDAEAPALKCLFNPGGDDGKTSDFDFINYGLYTTAGYQRTLSSAIAGTAASAATFTVDGLTVAASAGSIALYNAQGISVGSGAAVTAPAPGIYIVVLDGHPAKILLR